MPRKRYIDLNKVYISERLKKKLDEMSSYPLTLVETPLGYGKTTVMREYLKSSGRMHVWITAVDPSVQYFWKGFCSAIGQISHETGEHLAIAGFPGDSVAVCEAADIIEAMELEMDVYVVIDDYQVIFSEEVNRFFEMLARKKLPGLHVVLMGRQHFDSSFDELELKKMLLFISQSDFMLDEDETRQYLEWCGARVDSQLCKSMQNETEGFMSAIYMALGIYVETGKMEVPINHIFSILENSLYEPYSEDVKDFLMRICIFDSFTMEQARFVRRKDDPSQILKEIVAANGFIKYDLWHKTYHIHSLYARFLRQRLGERGIRYRYEVYRHAADWHYLNGNYFLATVCYSRSGNYEDVLKCFERNRGRVLAGYGHRILEEAFAACPEALRAKHPLARMIYARLLFLLDEREKLESALQELKTYLASDDLTEKERQELGGEYEMLLGDISYNDLMAMNEHYKAAARMLKRPSYIEDSKAASNHGVPSILYMYYRKKGTLADIAKEMHASKDLYYKLTENAGRGGEYLLDAELEYNRNRLDKAEILAYKAYNVAKKYSQVSVVISSLFLMARISMLNGDSYRAFECLREMKEIAKGSGLNEIKYMTELAVAFIYSFHNQLNPVEKWIASGDIDAQGLYFPAKNFAYIIYGRILIDNEDYSRFLGTAENFINSATEYKNLLTELYTDIYGAIAYREIGMTENAIERLSLAIDIAMEDELFMPFVENGRSLLGDIPGGALGGREQKFLDKCQEIYKKYEKNLNMLLREDDNSPLSMLTKREQEIALLVADGKTNMEIAKELNIAEITVKKSLSNIYARLGISNRTSLLKKISV